MRIKSCPVCSFENQFNSLVCGNCGSTFTSGKTLPVRPVEDAEMMEAVVKKYLSAHPDSLLFFIQGYNEPLIVPKDNGLITLGREVPDASMPTLSFNPYNAGMLGVSRKHAVIEKVADSFMIMDRDSTNKTWVNEQMLIPNIKYQLNSGDTVKLGQLVMRIYYAGWEVQEEAIYILDTAKFGTGELVRGLSTVELFTHVSKFLSMLGEIQEIVDEIYQRQYIDMSINGIESGKADSIIKVRLEGVGDAIRLTKFFITPWRRANQHLIADRAQHRKEFEKALQELAIDLINRVKPELVLEEKVRYARRIFQTIIDMTVHPLEVLTGTDEIHQRH